METVQPEALAALGKISVPENVLKSPFTASKKEKITAFAIYVLSYIYVSRLVFCQVDDSGIWKQVWLAVFTLGFLALGEYLHHDAPRSGESRVWLICTLVIAVSIISGRCRAWGEEYGEGLFLAFLFLHIFAVWWLLSRSGTLLAGESGIMLPLDALNGFIIFPFQGFFLRIKTVWHTFMSVWRRETFDKPDKRTALWTAATAAAALGLLAMALRLLRDADDGFEAITAGIAELFDFRWSGRLENFLMYFELSLPVGAYLFGLLDGTLRLDRSALRQKASRIDKQTSIKAVSGRVWQVLLGLFCVLYALFFIVQGRYLFGAFTRTLPEGFIVSQYARRGFFELCSVMAVNFALLFLAWRTAKDAVPKRPALILLGETFLLAVVAFSKLALYIDCFGFTPKRLQSLWLICLLSFGCACCMYSLITGKKSFRGWMYFGAISLSVLCLY